MELIASLDYLEHILKVDRIIDLFLINCGLHLEEGEKLNNLHTQGSR